MIPFDRTFLFFILLVTSLSGFAQAGPIASIQRLFDAMRLGDAAAAAEVFHPNAVFFSISQNGDTAAVQQGTVKEFVKAIGNWAPGFADERMGRPDVRIDGNFANVWMAYHFYSNGNFHHCGSEAFTLVKTGLEQWQILTGVDTRQTDDCTSLQDEQRIASLDTLMNRWHNAAATADEDVFFGAMSEDGIYLGTDASERWLRDSMAVWADPYFQRETAWAFTPLERNWYFSDDGQVAWFEEHLSSWMGVVRGSGVLSLKPGSSNWELRHYNLAMAVPNERMDAVRMAIDSTATPRD